MTSYSNKRYRYRPVMAWLSAGESQGKRFFPVALMRARGKMLQHIGQWQEADLAFRKCLKWAEQTGKELETAESSLNIASLMIIRGDMEEAQSRLEQVSDVFVRTKQPVLLIKALTDLGNICIKRADHQNAWANFQRCLAISGETGLPSDLMKAYNGLGHTCLVRGDLKQAEEYFGKELALAEQHRELYYLDLATSNLALVFQNQGHWEKSLDYHRKSIEIAALCGNQRSVAQGYVNRGTAYLNRSRFNEAEDNYRKALLIYRRLGDRPGEAMVICNLGIVDTDLEHYLSALKHLHQSLVLNRRLGLTRMEAVTLGGIGQVFLQRGKYKLARRYFELKLDISKRHGLKKSVVYTNHKLGILLNDTGRHQEALALLDEGLAQVLKMGDIELADSLLEEMAKAFQRLGDHANAVKKIEEAIASSQSINAEDLLGPQLFLRGELHLQAGQKDLAAACFHRALELTGQNNQPLLAWRCRLHLAGAEAETIEAGVRELASLLAQAGTDREKAYAGYHLCMAGAAGEYRKKTLAWLDKLRRDAPIYDYTKMIGDLSVL